MVKVNKARENLVNIVVKSLDEDIIPWRKNWNTKSVMMSNVNAVTNTPYRGINQLILEVTRIQNNYTDPRWMTFNKIKELKLHLSAGSKGVPIEYYYYYNPKTKKSLSIPEHKELSLVNPIVAEDFFCTSKTYYVFNGSCIEGLEPYKVESKKLNLEQQMIAIDDIAKNIDLSIFYDSNKAYYSPSRDEVHLPPPAAFDSLYDYVSVAMHEISHSTGHSDRLNRDLSGKFGSEKYAKEELVAEISSLFISNYFKNPSSAELDNHKAYIQNWSSIIKKDPTILFDSIKKAETASDYLLLNCDIEKTIETINRIDSPKKDTDIEMEV